MTNEHYLYVSYAIDGLFTLGLSLCVFGWLRRSHAGLADAAVVRPWATFLKRSFLFGMVLPAMLGYLSVSYTAVSCDDLAYKDVIADREWLIAKSHQQISGAFHWTAFAVFAWGILVVLILATCPRTPPESAEIPEGSRNENGNRD